MNTTTTTTTDITITESGLCPQAGYRGFGRYGDRAVGRLVDLLTPDGVQEHVISHVHTYIHTCCGGGGGENFVYAEATRCGAAQAQD